MERRSEINVRVYLCVHKMQGKESGSRRESKFVKIHTYIYYFVLLYCMCVYTVYIIM